MVFSAVNLESDYNSVIMDTSTNNSPSLRVNSKSKFKKPKWVSWKKKEGKTTHFYSLDWICEIAYWWRMVK